MMHLLRRVFFAEAFGNFKLATVHLPGIQSPGRCLSRNRLHSLSTKFPKSHTSPTSIPLPSAVAIQHRPGLNFPSLNPAVQYYHTKGIAPSTHQMYKSALKFFYSLCSLFNIVSPSLLVLLIPHHSTHTYHHSPFIWHLSHTGQSRPTRTTFIFLLTLPAPCSGQYATDPPGAGITAKLH